MDRMAKAFQATLIEEEEGKEIGSYKETETEEKLYIGYDYILPNQSD